MRPIHSLPPLPEPNPPVDWRAIRESLRAQLNDSLRSDLSLANHFAWAQVGGAVYVCPRCKSKAYGEGFCYCRPGGVPMVPEAR